MTTIQINERTNIGKNLIKFLTELSKEKKNTIKIIASSPSDNITKSEFLADFEQSLREVKSNKTKPLNDLLDGK